MLYYIGSHLTKYLGPARLLQSYAVLIILALYTGFIVTKSFLPKFYNILPHDRGRDFTLSKEASKGKPTGAGIVFVSFFILFTFIFAPFNLYLTIFLALTWLMMITGYLDDRSEKGWGEYIKAFLDLIICVTAAFLLSKYLKETQSYFYTEKFGTVTEKEKLYFWFPFVRNPIAVPSWLYIIITTVMLWVSVNTTNCTDGVDGLSSSLVLIALFTMGTSLYIFIGHVNFADYLNIPFFKDGACWAIATFCFAGVVMGYLWHNAFPSSVLMGDAGSRALGFYIGLCVMLSGNILLFLATSSIIFINGGMGLLKVALKRFLHISIFEKVRFPLHDHMRKNRGWSPTQVLIKFMMMQVLITIAMLAIFFKIR